MKMKNVEDVYALSSMQQLMLVHSLAAGETDVLYEQVTCTLRGDLDAVALRRAWQAVMDRHPALRTAFAWEGLKKPLQVVRQQVALPWRQYDWRDAAPDEQNRRRSELLESDRREGFDLSRAPLMRLMLMQTADDSHEFAWSCHHLVLDGWCLSLIFKEVLDHYEAYRQGRSLQPPRPQPFRDYIAWLAKQDPVEADDFWRQKLAGFQTPVRLPIERWDQRAAADPEPRGDDLRVAEQGREPSAGGPSARSRGFGECRAELSSESTAALRSLAAQERITLSTILEGAWALLLARYSGSGDIVYGTTVSGRPPGLLGVETMLGPFINNLPVRVKLAAADRVKPWLAGLHAQKVESQQFEHAPLQQIQGLSELRQGGRLFESLVVLENYPLDSQEFRQVGCLQIDNVHGSATADYPLALIAMPGVRLTLRLRYDVRRFEAAYARQLLSDLEGLLEAVAADPNRRLIDLPLRSAAGSRPFDPQQAHSSFSAEFMGDSHWSALPPMSQATILDEWRRPAPPGVPGELLLRPADDPAETKLVAQPRSADTLGATAGLPSSAGNTVGQANRGTHQLSPSTDFRVATGGSSTHSSDGGTWQPTGDRVRRLLDGRIEYLGRVGDPLQIGVYRVDPAKIAELLRSHRLVDDAAVVGHRDPTGRMQLAAYVVAAEESKTLLDPTEHALLLDRLRTLLKQHLPGEVLPRAMVALEKLPRTAAGELDLAALPEPTRPRPPEAGPLVAPRDPLEVQLAAIWSELLGVYPIGITDNFMDLGGQSVLAVTLLARIEERFDRKLPLLALFHQPTVEHLAEMLRRPAASSEETSLVPIQPRGNRRPLFCVHPAGGTVFCYLELAKYLEADQPIYGLQAQGVEGLLAPHTEVEQMAAHYIGAIRTVQKTGPYLIGGWSSGGVIAFEVARQLEAQGETVDMLALFDAGVQGADEKAFDQNDFLPLMLMMFPGQSKEEIEALQQQSPEQQLAYFQQRAELAQLVVAGAAAGQAQHVFDVFQANVDAITRYRPQPYPGKITLFRASEHATPMHKDPYLGWGPWAGGGVEVHEVPGNHVTMFRAPTVRALAERLGACLEQLELVGTESKLELP